MRKQTLLHKQDIAIIGSGEDSIITCTEYTGLGVLYSVNITIESIVMKGCGVKNHQLKHYLLHPRYQQSKLYANVSVNVCSLVF